jgi:hypothetical protein
MYEAVKPWSIYRNENRIAQADSHNQVARIVRQLTRRYPHDKITVRFIGKAISHSGDRGTPL